VGVTGTLAAGERAPAGLAGVREPAGPVIVVTYAHAGAGLLQQVLAASPSMACTSGTGLVPLCHMSLATWRAVEGRGAGQSALAVTSVRALATTMITVLQARSGAGRWCETTVAPPEVVASFVQVFPSATFVCLHRALPGVLTDGLQAYPWGLGGSPFWPYASAYPGNNVATIAAYWAACTEPLLDFEARHRDRSLRIRYEDLARDTDGVGRTVYEFLGLTAGPAPALRASPPAASEERGDAEWTGQLGRLPERLRGAIDQLHGRLGYPALPATTR
jgi:hypothetical protein